MAEPRAIIAKAGDSVATAISDLVIGDKVVGIAVKEPVPAGHKLAIIHHEPGKPVIKLGQLIGIATQAIVAGGHIHSHNLAFSGGADHDGIGTDIGSLPAIAASFQGYVRADGSIGTRNYIGILTSVNCSASVARRIAAHFNEERLAAFPNIDGVVAFSHMSGCGMASDGLALSYLRKTIAGYARHPNFAAVLIVGLGCEVNQIDPLLASAALEPSDRLQHMTIQDAGGTAGAIAQGIAMVEAMLSAVNAARREAVSAAHLAIGLQCGASDGYSALTANPALGVASDMVVAAGGKVILSETPEIYGAENLLLRRAASTGIAQELLLRLAWWEDYSAHDGANLDNNPSPGNKAGGITTIIEKSLGAVAKSGSTPLNAVVGYADPVTEAGLNFMDTPGYDPCSATGQMAGGANMILFTTGRGSVFGSKPAPTLKLSSNSLLAAKMADDIDFDCGTILEHQSVEQAGRQIFDLIVECASGARSKSELLDLGDNEFVPWLPGASY